MPIFRACPRAAKKRLEDCAAKSTPAEDFTENIERVMKTTETNATRRERGVTELIVCSAFLRIHENIVCFAEFFEFFLGMQIVRIFIGMNLDRELAVSAFDFLFGGVSSNAQHFVVIAFCVRRQNRPFP